MIIGYARTYVQEQDFSRQKALLEEAGCAKIFSDESSHLTTTSHRLNEVLKYLREGDILVVCRLDHIGHSLGHLVNLVETLSKRKIGFRSLSEEIDTTALQGELVTYVFKALSEFNNDLVKERSKVGLAATNTTNRANGKAATVNKDSKQAKDNDTVVYPGKWHVQNDGKITQWSPQQSPSLEQNDKNTILPKPPNSIADEALKAQQPKSPSLEQNDKNTILPKPPNSIADQTLNAQQPNDPISAQTHADKLPSKPQPVFGLTVNPSVSEANIKVLGLTQPFEQGIRLAPATYQVEICKPGYDTVVATAEIIDDDVTIQVELLPSTFHLIIDTIPVDANITVNGSAYDVIQKDAQFPPGSYHIVVLRDGYIADSKEVELINADISITVELELDSNHKTRTVKTEDTLFHDEDILTFNKDTTPPEKTVLSSIERKIKQVPTTVASEPADSSSGYHLDSLLQPEFSLTVNVMPADATIELVDFGRTYHPNMWLWPGTYCIRISKEGYYPIDKEIKLVDSDLELFVELAKRSNERADNTTKTEPTDSEKPITAGQYQPKLA